MTSSSGIAALVPSRSRHHLRLWWLVPLACVWAAAIVTVGWPGSLALVVAPLVLLAAWHDMRLGIALWLVLSVLGNFFVVDLPGIVPLRTTHLVLFSLLGVWFVKSYKTVPAAVSKFVSTAKNRVLLLLLSWIALGMVMGRVTGVTQEGWKYQFNAWLGVALAILLSLIISQHTDRRLVKGIVWAMVLGGAGVGLAILATGILNGVGLLEWKEHFYQFSKVTNLVYVSPVYAAIVFFGEEKWRGRAIFAAGAALALTLQILMVIGGSRSQLAVMLATGGFLLLLIKPRAAVTLGLAVAVPIAGLNLSFLTRWLEEQTTYTVTSDRVALGPGTRTALWLDALQTTRSHPIWGTGSDFYRLHANVKCVGADQYGRTKILWATDAHNTWLQAAVDHGIPAAILLAVFFGLVLRDSWRAYRRCGRNVVYQKYALLFLATFCTTSLMSLVGEGVLPVFTATLGTEEVQLARYVATFWVGYGLLLGIEAAPTEDVVGLRPSVMPG